MRVLFTILISFFTANCFSQKQLPNILVNSQCDSNAVNGNVSITNYKGCVYSWSRGPIDGILPKESKGSSSLLNERLINNADTTINVKYNFTAKCPFNPLVNFNVIIPVKPSPKGSLIFNPNKTLLLGETLEVGYIRRENTSYIESYINYGDGVNEPYNASNTHLYFPNCDTAYILNLNVKNSLGCEANFTDSIKIKMFTRSNNNKDLYVYPNPYQDNLYLKYDIAQNETASIQINDLAGKVVFTNTYSLVKGSNILRFNDLAISSGQLYRIIIKSPTIYYEENIFRK
jgi:hypothetical protein